SSSQLQLALNASTGLELRVFALPTRLSADEECEERPARQRCLRRCLSRALRDFCGECFPEGIHLWDEEFAENAVFCPKSRCLLNSSLQKCRQNCPKNCETDVLFVSSLDSSSPLNGSRLRVRRQTLALPSPPVPLSRSSAELTALLGGLSVFWSLVLVSSISLLSFARKLFKLFPK
ncbi:unnamed protein product, partial [Oppiella nova]